MKRPLPFGLLLLVGLLAALGLPALAAADSPQQSSGQQVSIEMTEFMFMPMSFSATAGQPIQITAHNAGKFPHNVSFQLGSQTMQVFPANVPAGQTQTASFTFPSAGQWRMFCPVDSHAQRGMVGTGDVAAAGAGTAAATTATSTVAASTAGALPATGGGGMAMSVAYEGAAAVVIVLAAGGLLLQRRRARKS